MMTLASYLSASKISQADFAAAVGVQQPTVHRWLRGARPSWETAAKIEKATGGAVPIAVWADQYVSPSSDASAGGSERDGPLPSKDVGSDNPRVKGAA